MSRKVVITCALTGSFDTVSRNPAVPVTPAQIAESAIGAARAGAAIAHIHVRDPDTGKPSMDLKLYREVVERIRDSGEDVVINLTTGAGARFIPDEADPRRGAPGTTLASPEARVEHILELKPELCSLDIGSMNFGEHVFVNIPAHLRRMAELIREVGTKPELEVFDAGHVELAKKLIADGHITGTPLFQLCLGIPHGAPASTETMLYMRGLLPADAQWCAFGISHHEFPMVAQAAILGGQVRVGLEDNLYIGRGRLAESNAQLVERAVTIVESLGLEVATAAEARDLLGLRGGNAA